MSIFSSAARQETGFGLLQVVMNLKPVMLFLALSAVCILINCETKESDNLLLLVRWFNSNSFAWKLLLFWTVTVCGAHRYSEAE